MTAKEMAEKAKGIKFIGFCEIPIWNGFYNFSKDQLAAYIDQVCKEQRHECQIERNKKSICIDGVWFVACNDVLNAPQPDVLP